MARTIATNTRVDLDGLIEFVRPRHHMLLITQRADGSPQASPVSGGVDDLGRLVIASYPERAKTRNARRRPEVTVVVVSDDWNGAWVQVSGTCEVLDVTGGERALDAFVEYFRSISGEHSDWDESARRWWTRASRSCASRPPHGGRSRRAASRSAWPDCLPVPRAELLISMLEGGSSRCSSPARDVDGAGPPAVGNEA